MINKDKLKEIKLLISEFCEEYLNKDVEKTCNKLLKKLSRNKDFSIDKGEIIGWLGGFILVVGEDSGLFHSKAINRVNHKLYISKAELCRLLGVSITTIKNREIYIRSFLDEKNKFVADIEDEEFNYIPTIKDIENELKSEFLRSQLEMLDYEFFNDMILGDENYNEHEIETKNERNIRINMEKASECDDIKDAIKYMEKAIEYTKKEFKGFDELKGDFWGIPETRPYMMCKEALASLYLENGEIKKTISIYKEMLELNEMDNQGIRYKLINLLILDNDDKLFEELVNESEDIAAMLYPQALYYFYKKDMFNAKKSIKKALKANAFVPQLLFGLKESEEDIFAYKLGSEEEAMVYFNYSGMIWFSVKGACEWLFDEYLLYCKKNKYGLDIPYILQVEIRKGINLMCKEWMDQCEDIFKI